METFTISYEGKIPLDQVKMCRELNSRSRKKFVPGTQAEFLKEHFNPFKRQYDVVGLLDRIAANQIVLTDKDLFADSMNFVIGASKENRIIINMNRLFTDNNHILSFERAIKEILHQFGNMAGLSPCIDPACVMSPSPTVKHVDRKGVSPCQTCLAELAGRKAVL